MLRIDLTVQDLTRLRIAAGPAPLWELVLSLHMLQDRTRAPVFETWRRQVSGHLDLAATRLLMSLAPRQGGSAGFLTPTEGLYDLDEGIAAVESTPACRVRAELERLTGERGGPGSWTPGPAGVRREDMSSLGRALRAYHDAALAPFWADIQAGVDADRALRARALADGGYEGLLGSLHPITRGGASFLEIDCPVERRLCLDGRGLLLVPSYFCHRRPIARRETGSVPLLVYPIGHRQLSAGRGPAHRALAALLGATRAAILATIARNGGATTGELAHRVGVSPAAVSQHTTVLRDAGLIVTRRVSCRCVHAITDRGGVLCAERPDP
ncbi:ArsR/SmtB family transcription factor [Actinomadura rubrisoli]|uniref:ArsR family transcriptional regulator n=1 Tax=Actinomadura rubrisoli TaxID=2530368 RepID=A0A4V2YXG5_9ACTN|nr:winged helix-turn-helix domain-containing protein [Actinomadura rubrisoli]TDD89277.1 ArsR family transcriptional regulator [Actinomadura rubrisoli]